MGQFKLTLREETLGRGRLADESAGEGIRFGNPGNTYSVHKEWEKVRYSPSDDKTRI